MAAREINRRALVLGGLAVAAAMVLVAIWPRSVAEAPGPTRTQRRDAPPGPTVDPADPSVPPALGLEAMDAERATPANKRDLFRFGAARPDPDPGLVQPGAPPPRPVAPDPQPSVPVEQPPPLQPAGIPLRYVGFAETPGTGKVASLSDGRFMYNGREGDAIEGRWRIVSISRDAVVMENVDGSGRQTLRLSGGG